VNRRRARGFSFIEVLIALGLLAMVLISDGLATSYTVDTRTNSYAAKWQPQLDSKLENSFAAIVIASIETGGIVPPISASNGLRVVVTIHWSEGQRARSVDLIGVKT
jgi:prepilin-type N-terminal cleavage/methylation domain-containing protein